MLTNFSRSRKGTSQKSLNPEKESIPTTFQLRLGAKLLLLAHPYDIHLATM